MSAMRETMWRQPDELRRLLADADPARAAAERIRGRRTWLLGIGTSWHAAHHGAWLLRAAGADATALDAADVAHHGWAFGAEDAVLALSHTGGTADTVAAVALARAAGVGAVVQIGAIGSGADVETVARETSYAYTASHTGALLRLAQLAQALGAPLDALAQVPDAVARVLDGAPPPLAEPARLLQLTGAGPNAWTAQEGALKIREASYVPADGLASEQLLHGPSVALDERDALVLLDGGGPAAARSHAIADAIATKGAHVVQIAATELGEPLSIFPLTVHVQRIALALAEARGVSPDRFRYEQQPAWERAADALLH
jgi:glucosamine--fructose-6-phosphate aminotransferase (isomerizing)